jgi:hypothetical protein
MASTRLRGAEAERLTYVRAWIRPLFNTLQGALADALVGWKVNAGTETVIWALSDAMRVLGKAADTLVKVDEKLVVPCLQDPLLRM